MNGHCSVLAPRNCRGSALIAIIAAVLLFSVLAAALVSMVGSSSQQTAFANLSDRASYLAESGYRLAINRFSHAADLAIDPLDALDAVEGQYTLNANTGQIDLTVYSFFFRLTNGTISGQTTFEAQAPGRFPAEEITTLNGQQVVIDGQLYTLQPSSQLQASSNDRLNLTVDPALPITPLPAGTVVLPATTITDSQSLDSGGSLIYASDSGEIFPLRNGTIQINTGSFLTYRVNDRTNHTFIDIQNPNNPTMSGLVVPAGARVTLMPYASIHSTGIAGGGQFQARREMVYSGALPWAQATQRITFEDKFDTNANRWTPSTGTSVTVTALGGNNALQISASTAESLVTLEPANTQEYFNGFRNNNGNYLSYDTQVKMGFYSSDVLDFSLNPIPSQVTPLAAGLSFRLNTVTSASSYNGYNLSFLRGDNLTLPNGIVPAGYENASLMVLWQQILSAQGTPSRQWLAFKQLQTKLYPAPPQTFDDVIGGWTPDTSLWTILPTSGRNASPAWYYQGFTGSVLSSPPIPLSCPAVSTALCDEAPIITLVFWSQEDNVNFPYNRRVRISYDGGSFSAIAPTKGTSQNGWYPFTYNLSAHAGQTVSIQFQAQNSGFLNMGWHVDDVSIRFQWPIQNSTLAVRLQEAAVVRFSNGGPNPIAKGDWVRGATSNTSGTVIAPILLSSGSWAGHDAQGTLMLNDMAGDGFSTGETLQVIGSTTTTSATVQTYTDANDRRVNIIRAYYASSAGYGTADSDPLDVNTLPYPRSASDESLEWPVDDGDPWTADRDFFRLIQWDGINPAITSLSFLDPQNTMLRSHEPNLRSQSIDLTSPELGLHAYGTGAGNTYFDDFGFQQIMPATDLYPPPLQQ
ncbi:MAG: hypothetical protein M0036_27125 [Desulfobacteraceae bacterium]|nr:hypothetical protein [Desulfobacteraceae bacterium]